MKKQHRRILLYLLILVAIGALVLTFLPKGEEVPEGTIGQVAALAREEAITIDGTTIAPIGTVRIKHDDTSITVFDSDGKTELLKCNYAVESGEDLKNALTSRGVPEGSVVLDNITYNPPSGVNWGGLLINFLPLLFIIALFWFLLRGAQGASSQAFNFSRSRARVVGTNKPTVTFADVAGVDEAKQELQEVVEFLKSPQKFLALGARIPRGVLLMGPPGTGKTLLARAVAGEAEVPFYSISGSEFVEMFVGVGASRVRDLFDQAKRNSPCIVFVDEIDAVGRHRGAGLGGGHDEREQTLNQILAEMDGFDTDTNVIVISATNRPDILDPALLRPGRFDRQVVIDNPDINGRKAILDVHSRGKPLDEGVDLGIVAKQTPGFSGADLANLVNEAAILAVRRDKNTIGLFEFEDAIDRVIAGPERKSRIISQREKEIAAYHEAGHALVARKLPHADPVHKVSIITRRAMGGYTRLLPTEDRYISTRSQLNDMLTVLLGGHAAEGLIFDEMTTGPVDDIERATKLARTMVTRYGMSDKLGPRTFGRRQELVFLGKEITEERDYSEKVAQEIDGEVHNLIERAHNQAVEILTQNKGKLEQIAKHLIAVETVEGEELAKLFNEPVPSSSDQEVSAS